MNIEEVIIICGMQLVCRGTEAVGELEFGNDSDFAGQVRIPVCQECLDEVDRLTTLQDSGSLEQ